jgi:hypothetical protein
VGAADRGCGQGVGAPKVCARVEQVSSFLGDQEAGRKPDPKRARTAVEVDLRELVRLLYQDHLDPRGIGLFLIV